MMEAGSFAASKRVVAVTAAAIRKRHWRRSIKRNAVNAVAAFGPMN
jgi:hypothetical protein